MTQDYIKSIRTIIKIGNSYFCSLPLKFVNKHKLSKGDKLLVHGFNTLTIQVIDMGENERGERG
jgi:hypothetical protein